MRELRDRMAQGPVMSSPQVLRDWLRLRCAGLQHEVFLALYLDANHRLIAHEEVFRGTLTQTSVYPRELVKSALARNAAAIAVAHNHPSGQAEPSRADEFLTQTLKSALALVDIRLIDHFVVAGDQCVSFAGADCSDAMCGSHALHDPVAKGAAEAVPSPIPPNQDAHVGEDPDLPCCAGHGVPWARSVACTGSAAATAA